MEKNYVIRDREAGSKIFALCVNTKSGQIYVYLNSTKYDKKYPLRSDAFGYLVVNGKKVERFTTEEDISEIIDYINK